ncbi:MAG: CRTAC1 family protein [Phycisphaerae bacterium]
MFKIEMLLVLGFALSLGSAGSRAQTTFVDVTVTAGVDSLHWDGVVPAGIAFVDNQMLHMSGGAAAGDFDGDGFADLYVTRLNRANLLFHNRGDGTFEEVGAAWGVNLTTYSTGCAWGDVDNDSDLDLYVLTTTPGVRAHLFINSGTSFSEEAVVRGVDLPTGGGVHHGTSAAFGDYDRDGDLDLLVTEWADTSADNRLFANDGTGHFVDATLAAGLALTTTWGFAPRFADVNDDGWPDILIAGDFGTSRLYLSQGDGTFVDVTGPAGVGTDQNGMGSAVADLENDGDLDWFVTAIYDPADTCANQPCNWGSTGNRLYRNQGSAQFADATDAGNVRNGYWGWAASFLDCDNDGDQDLAMTNGMLMAQVPFEDAFNDDPCRFWTNDGTGAMTEVSTAVGFTDTRSGKGLVVFDYDRDGDLDLYIANNAAGPVLYRNDGPTSGHWLQVCLEARTSNAFGIGARVFVGLADGRTLMQEVSAGSNFMSQNDIALHFGLGPSLSVVQALRVVWPSGTVESNVANLAADRRVVVHEYRYGDCNDDGAVNSADHACFASCLQGPDVQAATCGPVDLTLDNDTDLADFAAWQNLLAP